MTKWQTEEIMGARKHKKITSLNEIAKYKINKFIQ